VRRGRWGRGTGVVRRGEVGCRDRGGTEVVISLKEPINSKIGNRYHDTSFRQVYNNFEVITLSLVSNMLIVSFLFSLHMGFIYLQILSNICI